VNISQGKVVQSVNISQGKMYQILVGNFYKIKW